MRRSINLGDVNTAALRSLIAQRSFSKAGMAINSTTNTYRIALGGAVQADDIITVSVLTEAGLVSDDYTVVGNEANVAAIATALELVIEALVGVASAVADSTNIDVTPAVTTEAIVVTAAVTKAVGTPALTAAVTETIIGTKGVKTGNTFMFGIDGHTGSQTTQTNVAIGGSVIPVSSYRWYLAVINTLGTVTTIPGEINMPWLPEIPASQAPIGAIKIATDGTHTFTPGVTALNATGITDTYYDLSCVPKAGIPA